VAKRSTRTSILFAAVVASMICVALSSAHWEWQTAARWAWLPGTLFGVVAGTYGSTAWRLARTGRRRNLAMTCGMLLLGACSGMLVGGLALLAMHRSWYIWYPWLLPGVLGCLLLPRHLAGLRRCYQEAEMRRLSASDISST
jgi:Na+/H+-translocating membrane pyrophosphatase